MCWPNALISPLSGTIARGDQIDEHLRHRLIEPAERQRSARREIELGDPQRPETAVVLGDSTQAERGRHSTACRCRAACSRCHSATGSVERPARFRARDRRESRSRRSSADPSSTPSGDSARPSPGRDRSDRPRARRDRRRESAVIRESMRVRPGCASDASATCAMNDADHSLGRRPGSRHERGPIAARANRSNASLRIGDVPGGDQRARHLRPADRASALLLGLVEQRLRDPPASPSSASRAAIACTRSTRVSPLHRAGTRPNAARPDSESSRACGCRGRLRPP